jgi:hypothetical protein
VSETVVVECGDQRFWAYDLALGVWITKALDRVTARRYQGDASPGPAELHDWERVAVLGSSSIIDQRRQATHRVSFCMDSSSGKLGAKTLDGLVQRRQEPAFELSGRVTR